MKKHDAFFNYHNKQIPFSFWVNADNISPDTVIFLGTGQIKRIPYWVAKAAPAGVVVVEGLPHWHSHPNAEDIVTFTQEYTKCAFLTILKIYNQTKMNVIAQSQAAPGVLWMANELSDKVDNIALILPMGLNTKHLGNTNEQRYRELKKRSLKSLFHLEQLGPKNIYAGAILAAIIAGGHKDGSTKRKYTKGVSHDATNELALVLKNNRHKVHVFLGEDDVLFPAVEVQRSLAKAKITNAHVQIIPRKSHTSLTTKKSSWLVARAIRSVRGT